MKIYLETMGCQMNKLDSELVAARLQDAGHELVADAASAEAVLYNTCSVRLHAEQKVCSRLGEQCKRKRVSDKRLIIGVLGCMAQRQGQELLEQFPGVDIVCGPGELDRLDEMIAEVAGTRLCRLAVAPPRNPRRREQDALTGDRLESLEAARAVGAVQAYVRVQRGCDNFCSYCIVPYVRGSEQSRDGRKVLAEVRRLAEGGCKEITLLGQTVNAYCYRDGGQTTRLADLLEMLEPVEGIERIRFVTNYPGGFDRAILRAMSDLPKVCEYLHVPAQSGSDRILKAMNRRYGVSEYLDLLAEAKATVGGLTVAGDFIVGFPGESEQDFQASCELVRKAGYKNSFIFKYSPRDGTAATRISDDVPDHVKRRRNSELLAVQNEVSLAHNADLVGTTQRVLVEGPSLRANKQPSSPPAGMVQLTGRTRGDHIVVFHASPAMIGRFADVHIASATALSLTGTL